MRATNSNAQNQKVRLLCVDDDPKFLCLFTAVLEAARYNVVSTSDPYHALEIATGGNFDLIILDHDMPGMNGAELACRIKQQKRDLPIILFSGNFSLPQAARDVVDEYVAKGESVELLLQRVSARVSPWLHWTGSRRESRAPEVHWLQTTIEPGE